MSPKCKCKEPQGLRASVRTGSSVRPLPEMHGLWLHLLSYAILKKNIFSPIPDVQYSWFEISRFKGISSELYFLQWKSVFGLFINIFVTCFENVINLFH